MTNFRRISIKFGDAHYDGFTNGKEYFYTQTSLAWLVLEDFDSVTRFLDSKWLKDINDKYEVVPNCPEISVSQQGSNAPKKVQLIDCDTAAMYIQYHVIQGNELAMLVNRALLSEALQIRGVTASHLDR